MITAGSVCRGLHANPEMPDQATQSSRRLVIEWASRLIMITADVWCRGVVSQIRSRWPGDQRRLQADHRVDRRPV